jgi:RNA recognition motif-containing protein
MIPGEDKKSEVAVIEFETQEEALSAQTRDQKDFHGNIIEVQIGSDTTLYVTNFLPTADEEYIRNLFSKYGEVLEVRFPSLKFQTKRRFCYVQFATSSAAHQATELDGKATEQGFKLVAKISDPSQKQNRSGAIQEGREIFCKNIDFKLSEKEVREAFARFGTIEKLHMPTNVDGSRRGFCFVTFSTKEEAEAALVMNEEMLGSRRLQVNPSGQTGAKRMASTIISRVRTSTSPSAEVNGDGLDAVETSGDRYLRTLGLMNIPDTVNDARIRALVEPFGRLIKIVLRPDHQGAIVEFADVNDAGKASLALEGKEIVPGRPLHVGSVAELKTLQAERKTDRVTSIKHEKPQTNLQPSGPIRRPQQPGARGGRRGGLGLKRAPAPARPADQTTPDSDKMDTTADSKDGDGGKPKKSNDDFRAMLQQKRDA